MIDFGKFKIRFPEYAGMLEARFDIAVEDAVVEMGADESRWHSFYNLAQYHLVAHLIAVSEVTESGDVNPSVPVRATEADDVVVEYAISKTVENSFDIYLSTSYGQRYVYYRRLAMGGPRAPSWE